MRARTGFSASPRRSRVQLSKNSENSKHKTRRVYFRIGQSHCGDHPVAAPFSRTKRDEQHLVFVLVDNLTQRRFQFDFLGRIQVTLENRKLKMIAETATGFEGASQSFVIRHIVANHVCRSHKSPRHQGNVFGDFAGQCFSQQPRLQFKCPAITDFVIE